MVDNCYERKACYGIVEEHVKYCLHGVQDLCSGCNNLTDECDEHLVTCQGGNWAGGCGGHSKIETWYTYQHDSCPYGPSSS